MIGEAMQHMLMENKEHFLIPGEVVASVQEDNTLTHAFLVLTKVKYSKIPVLDNQSKFKGLLSMPLITETMLGLDELSFAPLDELKVKDVMDTGMPTVENPYDLEEIMHLLVNSPFLPVVAKNGDFTGIVTRREMMKSFNHVAHNLEKEYSLEQIQPVHEKAE